jgi:cytochrome P450
VPVIAADPRPDYRKLKDLQYLDCVVFVLISYNLKNGDLMEACRMESLRLFPPVRMTVRKAARDDYIDSTFVPKGTLLNIPVRPLRFILCWFTKYG